ncbi:riboflavin kinase [Demequina sp. SO4-18]|uniref:riboflavin kinase n=1 Tax=Demequina sp. SO4-18 TaxID=3401026 RepID=UPI003B5ADA3A
MSGVVVPGDARGRLLGYPTANLADAVGAAPAADGIYAAWVRVGEWPRLQATASVGDNPTFADVNERRIEIYLHDFAGSLYGTRMEVEFVSRLRANQVFATTTELIAQAAEDVERSRAILASRD